MSTSANVAPARGGATGRDPSECVARFELRLTRFLGFDGQMLAPLPAFAREPGTLVQAYRDMTLTRQFDQRAVALQRTGRLGTYPSSLGQEATAVGVGAAMARSDVFLGTYRETGTMLVRGVQMRDILLYWSGDTRGMAHAGADAPVEDFPLSVPIASHAPHAVGVAYALKMRHESRAVVCVLGDGATSKGDFYEALNAAGVWQLPLVFVVVNNHWAISVPRSIQSHAQTLAQKAIAAGIDGEQVDGNDVVAVRHVIGEALSSARMGYGPRLVEALTYRLCDHTTADDARRYRLAAEVEKHQGLDPIARLRGYLTTSGVWTNADEERLMTEHRQNIEAAVSGYLAVEPPPPGAMFEHLFERLPRALEAQRDALPGAMSS
ncbi:MAG: pyruvate dehydrogenase (acetyl-transferring) E1 component subunit alpha [Proteobacteria bacterium]|nr:pyruvate dehydrogenase (acetyl-transferring) E1 component subunit alpha [Pseudomonadota bacterium]